jgi:tRNA A-37 threonylcarbamoyl transferase component Bud32
MTKSEADVMVNKRTVTKKFKKTKEGRKNFMNELYVYLLAKEKKLKFIPKLIEYNIGDQTIVTENVGKSLDHIPESDWQEREKHLPGISKIYKGLEKFGIFHNDLRYKNIVWNKKTNKYYMIDFDFVSVKNKEADGDFIIRNIEKKILKKKNKKGKKTKKKK